jgi:radical SAM superfamily enzyme YgiQ (UPF0313 family)
MKVIGIDQPPAISSYVRKDGVKIGDFKIAETCWGTDDAAHFPEMLWACTSQAKDSSLVDLFLYWNDWEEKLNSLDADLYLVPFSYPHYNEVQPEFIKWIKKNNVVVIPGPINYAFHLNKKLGVPVIYHNRIRTTLNLIKGNMTKNLVIDGEFKEKQSDNSFVNQKPYKQDILDEFTINDYYYLECTVTTGCVHGCIFCPISRDKMYYKDINTVKQDLSWMFESTSNIAIRCSQLTTDKKWLKDFCEWKINNYPKRKYAANLFAKDLDYETLYLLKRSGLKRVDFGVECFSDRMLKRIRKGETTADIERAVIAAKKVGIPIGNKPMRFGIGETLDDVEQTFNFYKRHNLPMGGGGGTTIIPGTKLFDEIGDPNNLEIQKTDNKESAKYFAKLKRERK